MRKIHLICNAHLDPVWLWRWEEGCTEAISTFRTASELIDEFDGFKFNHNEAVLYEWVKENEPALYEKIKEQVKAGTFKIMGGWYLQPDCNMPMGESIVRNIMMGKKFFSDEFGVEPTTAINFDSFGHSKGLVQILNQAGYDSYVVCRPAHDNFDFKSQDYYWKGFNNSSVVVHRSDENYNSIMGHAASELKAFLDVTKDEEVSLFLWGVGDHGGGPSKKDLADLEAMFKANGEEYIFVHSSTEEYMKERLSLDSIKSIPVVDRGLNPVADGCYTSQVRVKQKHRELENEIYSGEKMISSAAIQYGIAYPKARIDEAVRDLVFAEFHDALPGSGTQNVEEDTLRALNHGLEIMSQEKIKAFIALSQGQTRVIDGTSSVLIYNPQPYEIEDVFEFEVGLPKQNWEDVFYIPEVYIDDKRLPSQSEMESSHFCIDWRKKVAIRTTLKASSITKLDVHFKAIPKRATFPPIIKDKELVLDNGKMRIVINLKTGLMDSYKIDGVEFLKPRSFELTAHDSCYNAWGLHTNDSNCEYTMSLLTSHDGSEFSGLLDTTTPSIRIIEDGEVQTVVEALFGWHNSKAYQRYIIPKEGTSFDIETGVYWNEKDKYLKLSINNESENGDYSGEVMFGADTLKTTGEEVVAQKWVMYKSENSPKALAVINRGTYGSSMENGKLGITLLRSAGYSAADGSFEKTLHEVRHTVRMEQGERIYHFRICADTKGELAHSISKKAQAFNELPYALAFCPSGKGEKQKPILELSNEAIIVSCFKLAENKEGYILRLYESEGKPQSCSINLSVADAATKVSFNAFELKTFYIDTAKKSIQEVSLLEK